MDEPLIPRTVKIIRHEACLDFAACQQNLAQNLKVKDHQKARETENSRYKKKNTGQNEYQSKRKWAQRQYISVNSEQQ